ncbi:MAG: hypothetical protein ACF8NJ_08425 [Phycisphaerales bacterium JB038]
MRAENQTTSTFRVRQMFAGWAVLLLLLVAAPLAPGQTSPAAGREALRQLEEEGEQFLEGELELPKAPDFALRFADEIDRGFILRQLYKVHDRREPVVDAYIRWQLLSYQPRLAEYEPWEIEKLFRLLPELVVNPCAEPKEVERFEKMLEAYEKIPKEEDRQQERFRQEMREAWWELRDEREEAELLNRPARAFAAYWREHLKEIGGIQGPHEPRLAWADFHNTLQAGFKVSTEKGRLTKALKERRGDATYSRRDRVKLQQRIDKLTGVEYRVLDEADIPFRGTPRLRIGRRYVSEADAKRWMEALEDSRPIAPPAGEDEDEEK